MINNTTMSLRKQKVHKPEFKVQVVLENLQGKAQSEIARQYGIHQQLITNWKRHLLSEAPKIFSSKTRDNQENQKIEELEKIIGRQTIEIQFLKKVLGHLD